MTTIAGMIAAGFVGFLIAAGVIVGANARKRRLLESPRTVDLIDLELERRRRRHTNTHAR